MTNIDHFCFDILCGPRGSRFRDSSNELRVGMDIKVIHSIDSKTCIQPQLSACLFPNESRKPDEICVNCITCL